MELATLKTKDHDQLSDVIVQPTSSGADETDGDLSLALAGAIIATTQHETIQQDEPKNSELKNTLENIEATSNGADVEYFCGVGPWHPPWLQRLRDARVFTFLLCLFSAVEGALVSGMASIKEQFVIAYSIRCRSN